MPKVHPNANALGNDNGLEREKEKATLAGNEEDVVLTVWRKSLLFNGNGFTVFDAKGNLVFRVDNYASDNKGEIVLMDGSGKSAFTVRKKKLSFSDHWLIYEGEEATNPKFFAKKHVNLLQSKSLAHINHYTNTKSSNSRHGSPSSSPHSPFSGVSSSPCSSPKAAANSALAFEVEGSYTQRKCTIFDEAHRPVAEIKCKESPNGGVAYGLDIFRLIVKPRFDVAVAMAIVVLLEQMFGSKGSSLLIKG